MAVFRSPQPPLPGELPTYFHPPSITRAEFRAQFIIAAIRAGEPHGYIHSITRSMKEAEAIVFGD